MSVDKYMSHTGKLPSVTIYPVMFCNHLWPPCPGNGVRCCHCDSLDLFLLFSVAHTQFIPATGLSHNVTTYSPHLSLVTSRCRQRTPQCTVVLSFLSSFYVNSIAHPNWHPFFSPIWFQSSQFCSLRILVSFVHLVISPDVILRF